MEQVWCQSRVIHRAQLAPHPPELGQSLGAANYIQSM